MMGKKINYRIVNLAALMVLLYVGILNIHLWWGILAKVISVLSPFIIGFAFAYALTPLVRFFDKKKIPHWLSVLIVVLASILVIVGILGVTLPMLYDQISLLVQTIAEVFDNIGEHFHINVGPFELKITDYLNDTLKSLGAMTSTTTIGFVGKSLNFVSKFIVGFVGFIYFLADMKTIRKALKELLLSMNKRGFKYVKSMDEEITQYLKGLEIFMVIQLFEYSLLFLVIGHPNWLILGILACITTVIPYFGGLITNIIAIILASVVSTPLMIATIIICLIFPQLDGYLISPKVYGKTNNVNPLITIMVVSVGGTVAGPLGIIVALPIYLLIRETYQFFRKDLKKGMDIVKETI